MEKFVAYEKLSKKQQKQLNTTKRKTWGDVKPITKIKPSAKLYNRKKKQDLTNLYSSLNPVFVFCFILPAGKLPVLPVPVRILQSQGHRFGRCSLPQLRIYDGTPHGRGCC